MAIVRTTHRAARVGHDRARGEWADMAGCTGPADARGGPGGSPALPCLTGLAGRAAAGLLLALAVLAAIMPMRASAQDKDAARAPNIVIVLADDLGYGDVGYLNSQSQIPTPNLDTLAGQGMAFLDAHSPSAICTPTRYGLLTGRYAWRTRLTRGVLDGYDGPLIAPNRETLGSFLGATGYRTAVIGKWHLGLGFAKNALGEFDFEEPIDDGPHTHGFDESYIIPASLDFPPYVYIRDGEITGFPLGQQSGMEFPRYMRAGELASDFDPADVLDELIRQATGFIQRQASDGSPFLLYLPLTAPHKPVWPAQRFEGTTELGPYGDFIVQVDAAVGDVMSALDQAGVDDSTLLIVTSDNGSFMSRLDRLDDRDHTDDSTIQAYRAGNHTANHVYRGTKADIWEGGHRVPFFARWPGQIEPGSTREEVISLTDVFATVAEIVGKELPNNAAEDSFSLLPLLRGNPWARPRAAVTHHSIQGMFAIRDGRWKLVAGNGSGGREDPIGQPFERPYQLFDIASDPSEQSNVYDQHPAVAQRLERELERIRSWDRSRMTTDMAALVALYNGTNGANWKTNTNWLSEAPLVSLWDWHGVTTDENGRVTELALASNDLSGTIPAELGERNLTKLQRLDLSENELSGAIPLTLMTLSQLSVLNIRSTTLCAPADTAFQAWLATINFQGVVCADPPPPPPPPPITGGGGGPRQTVPDTPTKLMADATDGTVTLTWEAPEDDGGSAVTDYQYRINSRGDWISIGSTNTTHTVTRLVNGTEYTFQVRAVNRIGRSQASDPAEAMPRAPGALDFAHFANGSGISSEIVLVNVAPYAIQPALYFYDQEGEPIAAESMVDVLGDLGIQEDGGLTIRTEMEPLGELTISTHGRGDLVSGSVKVAAYGAIGGVLRFDLPGIGVAGVQVSQTMRDAIFPVRRREGGINTGMALHNREEEAAVVSCRLMKNGAVLEEVEITLAANGQVARYIEEMFTGTDTSDFVGSVRCMAPGLFTGIAVELDAGNRIVTTLPVVPVDPAGGGGRETVLDFAHFANGEGIVSELVFVNRSTQPSRPAPTHLHSDILPNLPVLYFYDQGGDLIDPGSVVDVTGDLVVTEDGALTVQTEIEPLGVLTISTHGRGDLLSGSMKVTSDRPIGGFLRFDLPGIGVAGVGASQPVRDAIFPARRQAGGISTAAAIRNLEAEAMVVSCRLMQAGAVLEEMEIHLAANGQEARYIEEMFTGTDTSDFVGSVRCTAPAEGEGMFTGVAVELDAGNRILTTLPVVPVQERMSQE